MGVWACGRFHFLLFVLLLLCAGCHKTNPQPQNPKPKTQNLHPDAPGWFTDATRESGLTEFVHSDGSCWRKFFVEQMGAGSAFFDYNNDGWLDVYLCNGAPLPGWRIGESANRRINGSAHQSHQLANALFHNNHDGTFTDVTEKAGVGGFVNGKKAYSIGCAVGDYDNDGCLDLYVTNYGPDVLYHNNGDGTFNDVTTKAGVGDPRLGSSATFFDYDHDGFLDLYVCNYVKWQLDKDLFCFQFKGHKSYCGPNLYKPEVNTLYHNNGDGTFTDVSEKAGIRQKSHNSLGVVVLDYNSDGWEDLFVADDQTPNMLWRNNKNSTFTEVGLDVGAAFGEDGRSRAGMGVDVGDYDNDGKMDIIVTNFSEEPNTLYKNEGGTFVDVSYAAGIGQPSLNNLGFGCGFLDFDRDGWLDVFVANGHVMDDIEMYSDVAKWKQPKQLLRNKGNGTYEEIKEKVVSALQRKAVSRGVAFGDYDNDGDTDILVCNLRESPLLLRNDSPPRGCYLQLNLKASWGNPQAIGSTVTVKTGSLTQRRDVRTCGSYASSNDVRPLFGLGKAERVDEVRVRWTSGRETVLHDVKADQLLQVKEPPP
jgi:hypothetical protein